MVKRKITQDEWNKEREHWKTIVNCVFRAEDALGDNYKEKLCQVKGKPQDEIDAVCDEYVGAIADEILGCTFDVEQKSAVNKK